MTVLCAAKRSGALLLMRGDYVAISHLAIDEVANCTNPLFSTFGAFFFEDDEVGVLFKLKYL